MDGPVGTITVAVGQAACVPSDVSANVGTAAGLVRAAAAQGADVVVLPELFPSGYELSEIVGDTERNTVEFGGPRLEKLTRACADTRTVVVAGGAHSAR